MLNLLRYEDLTDVVLVGHSYAGAVVITAAADRMPDRVAKLVFVDTGPLPDGTSQSEFDEPGGAGGDRGAASRRTATAGGCPRRRGSSSRRAPARRRTSSRRSPNGRCRSRG